MFSMDLKPFCAGFGDALTQQNNVGRMSQSVSLTFSSAVLWGFHLSHPAPFSQPQLMGTTRPVATCDLRTPAPLGLFAAARCTWVPGLDMGVPLHTVSYISPVSSRQAEHQSKTCCALPHSARATPHLQSRAPLQMLSRHSE